MNCKCGCKEEIDPFDKLGRERRFKQHHQNRGRKHSIETKNKISVAKKGTQSNRKGSTMSIETKKKMSISHKGKKCYWYGKKRSEETKQKIRNARKHQIIPLKNTKPERFMQSILSINGIDYTTHKPILGQPDVFIEPNICIFVDGDYWHSLPKRIKSDKRINSELRDSGYKVLRFWEHEIHGDLLKCLNSIKKEMS